MVQPETESMHSNIKSGNTELTSRLSSPEDSGVACQQSERVFSDVLAGVGQLRERLLWPQGIHSVQPQSKGEHLVSSSFTCRHMHSWLDHLLSSRPEANKSLHTHHNSSQFPQ